MEADEPYYWFTLFNPDDIGRPLRKPKTTAPQRDTRRWMRPKAQESTCYTYYSSNASSKGYNMDVDVLVRSSKLSASAPEFVPSCLSASAPEFVPSHFRGYESTDIYHCASRGNKSHPVPFSPPSANVHQNSVGAQYAEACAEEPVWDAPLDGFIASEQESLTSSGGTSDHHALKVRVTHVNSPGSFNFELKSVGAEDTEPSCAEEVWDPPLAVLKTSEQESLTSSGSASDQGSLRDQDLDTVDLQPNLELPACLDKLKVNVTHVNSPQSFHVQHTQNNMQLKSVGAEDTEPCTEDPPEWESDIPEWEDFIKFIPSEQESLTSSGSASDQESLMDHQALDTVDFQPNLELPACIDKLKVNVTYVNSPQSFPVQHTQNNIQLKSVGVEDTEPCTEDPPLPVWEWDPPEWEWSPLEVIIPSEQESLSGSASDQGSLRDQALDTVDFQPNLELPACLDKLKVRVTHANSPGSFYVQLTQNNFQLKRLQELLKQEYGSTEPQDVQWEADMYCAVLINGLWERGQICNTVASTNTAEVRRCDFGNRVSVHMSSLRPLQDSLVGSLVLECTLRDIRPAGGHSTWTATACDLIMYYLTGAMATMTIKEPTEQRPVPVSLFCANQKGKYVCVGDFLVEEGLALKERKQRSPAPSSPTLPVVIPKLVRSTSLNPEKVETTLYQPPDLPCHGHMAMSISAVGDDGVIYARTKHAVHQLEQLKHGIQQQIKTLPIQKPYTWKCVQGCSVLGPDMHWHRGQLLEVISGHVRVRYVDSGHVEDIPVVHVYPMLLCEEVPQLCIPCQLYGLIPVGRKWQVDAVALLRNLLVGRVLDMQVMELPLESRSCVTVQIFVDGQNLSQIMCHHQHASVDRTVALQEDMEEHVNTSTESDISLDKWDIDTKGLEVANEPVLGPFSYPSLPEEGDFRVRVKHLYTPNKVFLVPVEDIVLVNGETLEDAINRVNADIDSLPCLSNYPLGGACLAEYGDGRYYRARMMEFVGVNPPALLVQHVDFGSDDIMLTSKLRKMPAELLNFPASALKVRLCGFKPPRVNLETEMLPYSPEWSVKAAQVMIKLLHGKITASLVAREPEPSVQLYDENGELVHLPLVDGRLADFDLVPDSFHVKGANNIL